MRNAGVWLVCWGLMAAPLAGASFRSLEIILLPRSGGRILIDVRGEIEEAVEGPPRTVIRLDGLRRPTIKEGTPSSWPWKTSAEGVSAKTTLPRGYTEMYLQVEGYPTGALRVFSDLKADQVRIFLPRDWPFDAPAVDEIPFNRWRLKVYQIPAEWPIVIPTGKGKPWVFFAGAGVGVLLALLLGLWILRRRSPEPPIPEEPPLEEETPEEVEPSDAEGLTPEEESQPAFHTPDTPARSAPQEPSVLNDPFVGLEYIPETSEQEREEEEGEIAQPPPAPEPEAPASSSPEPSEPFPPGPAVPDPSRLTEMPEPTSPEPPTLEEFSEPRPEPRAPSPEATEPALSSPDSEHLQEDDLLLRLGREVGIPEDEPPPVSVEEQLVGDASGPPSIEESLLAGESETVSPEEILLSEDLQKTSPSVSPETSTPPERKEVEPPASREVSSPPESPIREETEEEMGIFAGSTGGTVEASPMDMLDLPASPPVSEEPEEPPPRTEDDGGSDEDLRVELDPDLLASRALEDLEEGEKPVEVEREKGPSEREEVKPETPPTPPPPSPPRPEPKPKPKAPRVQTPPASPITPRKSLSPTSPPPAPPKKPAKPSTTPPPPPPKKPESPGPRSVSPGPPRSSPPPPSPDVRPPSRRGHSTPKDREALIREWLLKRKKRRKES